MLKYIGDFNELKEYGFTQSLIKDLIIKTVSKGETSLIINKRTGEVYGNRYFKYEQTKIIHNITRFKVIKQLIKDGLIKKE